jgi:DNA polymerase-3 subunit epsilon
VLADFDMKNQVSVDVQVIFRRRTYLRDAFKILLRKNLENAHSAEADTVATYEILKAN